MSIRTECLRRIGDNVKKYKIVILDGKEEVTFGRNPDVTVCILSTMISRCHAILKKTETGSWTIKDNKSLNGVFVNDRKLEPMKPCDLQEGDLVQLGVRTSPDVPPEFLFKYYKALKVKRIPSADAVDGFMAKDPAKRARIDAEEGTCTEADTHDRVNTPQKQSTSSGQREHSPYFKFRKKIDEKEFEAAARMAEMEVKLKEMQEKLKAKESAQQDMVQELLEEKKQRKKQLQALEDLRQKEEKLKQELDQKQAELAREKKEFAEKMREELEDQLQIKEASLLEGLEKQKLALLEEKKTVEDKLKQELEAEREKDKKLTEELLQQKSKLEKVIETKEAEQKLLESQLNDTRQEKDRKQEEVLRAREAVLSNFAELMETELQCSICSELFIRATTLNCSHAFCSLCINQWMNVKKECPQCRAAITTHMRSIVLDSYIDKMVEQFSDDMKTRRQELVEDRKKEEEAFELAKRPQPATARGGRGRRGRGRGGRGRVARAEQAPEPALPAPPPVLISDNDDDEDSDDSFHSSVSSSTELSDDSVSGDDHAYYGGYGRCFICGARGHWSNGCPFR